MCVQELDIERCTDVQLKACEAYEIIKLPKQKVTMEVNPAYEEIYPNNVDGGLWILSSECILFLKWKFSTIYH